MGREGAEPRLERRLSIPLVALELERGIVQIVAQTAVDPLTTTVPDPLPFATQVRITETMLVVPAVTANPAMPAHVKAPSAELAFNVIV